MSLAPSTLSYWVKAYKGGKLGEIGKTQRPLTEIEMELARTKKELVEVKMERDILKKAAAYFTAREASFERISQRVLRMAGQAIIKVGPGRSTAGGRDQSGA